MPPSFKLRLGRLLTFSKMLDFISIGEVVFHDMVQRYEHWKVKILESIMQWFNSFKIFWRCHSVCSISLQHNKIINCRAQSRPMLSMFSQLLSIPSTLLLVCCKKPILSAHFWYSQPNYTCIYILRHHYQRESECHMRILCYLCRVETRLFGMKSSSNIYARSYSCAWNGLRSGAAWESTDFLLPQIR